VEVEKETAARPRATRDGARVSKKICEISEKPDCPRRGS
jgi:hypothetical protein